ncbi:MAG TPA: bifunctional riboflavin kinase/FAD synthetase [Clostridiales bacterium]|nr:bifunctional riboflavin kinase/FAD synthetase [Clostridiales bacterium]
MDGFINLYKPPGFTSHDALNIVRRSFPATKIGHGGTLDPAATGVLPVCLGKATKLQDMVMGQTKVYEADVIFGLTSLSLDMSGEVRVTDRSFILDEENLKTVLKSFVGEQMQLPPAVSAIKQGGVPLYKLARKGQQVELKPRRIVIEEIALKEVYAGEQQPRIRIAVTCGKGTYIRSLGRDIGEALGTTAVIDRLVRLAAGDFTAASAYTLEEIETLTKKRDYSFVMPMDFAVRDLPVYQVKDGKEWKAMTDGNSITEQEMADGKVAVYDMHHVLMAIAEAENGVLLPKKILWQRRKRKEPLAKVMGLAHYDREEKSAVVIGNFDGVHLGHRFLIEHCVKAAEAKGLLSVVFTFYPHPKIFFGAEEHSYLSTEEEKSRIIDGLGADVLLTADFDAGFAEISAERFVGEILKDKLHGALVYVGEDFSFGKGGGGDAQRLKTVAAQYGIEVEILSSVTYQGQRISTSKIKEFLAKGDVIAASHLLGGAYTVSGTVSHGNELGRDLGFPTANLDFPPGIFIPKAGVYIAYADYNGVKREAVANVGKRPTVEDGLLPNIEVHILSEVPDLYGKKLTVTLLCMIREEKKFASLADLSEAIAVDREKAESFFENRRSGPCNCR